MTDILTGTPPELTYLHPLVREAWTVVWAVASGVLVFILGWMGLSLIMQHHLGQTQNGWREMVPRLVLGLVAAATSLWWCALIIDLADAVSGFIAASLGVTAGDLLRTTLRTLLTAVEAGSVGMAIVMALLYMVYGFFVLYVLVQMILRLALIDLLLALAPIALGLWILPHTAGWGRHWLRLFMTTVYYVFPDDFGDCLVRFKEKSGLSWAEIARRLGTTPLTVRRWWKHGVRPSSHYLLALQDLADGMGLGHMLPKVRVRRVPVRTGGPFPD